MSLYERNGVYWVSLTHQGRRIQQSTGTRDKVSAQRYHDEFKASLWKKTRLNEIPDYLWNDAVIRWLKESQHKRSLKTDIVRLRYLDAHLSGLKLREITRDVVQAIIATRTKEGVSVATINRNLALIRAILRKAEREWNWLERAPAISLRKENNERVRWLTKIEAAHLKKELPSHLADAMELSLNTGLRESNVAQLEWSEVDFTKSHIIIPGHKTKNGKPWNVPLNDDAIAVIRRQLGKHQKYVFTYRGKPVQRFNNWAWRKALVRAGINDFVWHDLRHTWASWHVQAGTSLHELQILGNWSSYTMVLRYAHLSSAQLRQAASRVTKLLHQEAGEPRKHWAV